MPLSPENSAAHAEAARGASPEAPVVVDAQAVADLRRDLVQRGELRLRQHEVVPARTARDVLRQVVESGARCCAARIPERGRDADSPAAMRSLDEACGRGDSRALRRNCAATPSSAPFSVPPVAPSACCHSRFCSAPSGLRTS